MKLQLCSSIAVVQLPLCSYVWRGVLPLSVSFFDVLYDVKHYGKRLQLTLQNVQDR